MRKNGWWLVCLFLLFDASVALAKVNLKDVVAFGDSLTDNDLLWIVYESKSKDLYGRDPIHAVFCKGPDPDADLWKYAAASTTSDELEEQIYAYEAALLIRIQDKATLFSIESGGNDILNNIDLLASCAPGQNSAADEITANIIDNLRNAKHRLRDSHPGIQIVVWTIPDVTVSPKLRLLELTKEEAQNVRAHIQRVNRFIRNMDRFSFVAVFDLYASVRKLIVTPPVIFGHPLVLPPEFGDYDNLFADELHPTAVTNAILANEIIRVVNQKWDDNIPLYSQAQLAKLAHISR